MSAETQSELVRKIMAFESGQLDLDETTELFGELVASGLVWQLQGGYGRMAARMIEAGRINDRGEVLE